MYLSKKHFKMKKNLYCWIICSVLFFVEGQGQTCGVVGTDTQEFSILNGGYGFYLNTQEPAQCDGTLSVFDYCFYRSDQLAAGYDFTFAVYRENGGVYQPVSTAYTTGRNLNNHGLDSDDTFGCASFSVDPQIEVQSGDVIGVCIYDPPESGILSRRVELDVVGQNAGTDRFLMMTDNSGCGDNMVPASVSSLNAAEDLVLHVWANIRQLPTEPPPPTTQMGTPPSTTVDINPSTSTPTSSTAQPSSTSPSPTSVIESSTTLASNDPMTTIEITLPFTTNEATTPPPPVIRPQDNTGIVAAIVVVILVLVVAAAVMTAVGVLFSKRRRRKSVNVTNCNQSAIENAVYSELTSSYQEIEPKSKGPSGRIFNSGSGYDLHTYESTSLDGRSDQYAEIGPRQDQPPTSNLYEYTSPMDGATISYKKLLLKNEEEDIYGSENPYEVPASHERDIYAQLKMWGVQYIHRSDIEITGHLGSGQFGSVEQGVWKRQGTKPVDVALKSLTKTSEEDKVKFLQEAAIMAQFKHPNVIILHGMVARAQPMMITVELATRGDLHNYLLAMRPDPGQIMPGQTAMSFLKFSQQVALGMQYLSAKGFVHRDLAARNVLLTEDFVCKVADFGLSRNLAEETYYVSHGGRIPVKWTAPEAIHYKKYSTASDVWSYGCLLYEIWSVGHKPFEGIKNIDAIRMVDSGQRLTSPPGTPRVIYELMIKCWHPKTSQRLVFRDIGLALVGREEIVLNIPEEDSSTNPLAGILGAPLEAGENMYSELQRRYVDL